MAIENDIPAPASGDGAASSAGGVPDRVGTRIRDAYWRSPGLVDHRALHRMANRGFNRSRVPLASWILGRWRAPGTFYPSQSPFLYARLQRSLGADGYVEPTFSAAHAFVPVVPPGARAPSVLRSLVSRAGNSGVDRPVIATATATRAHAAPVGIAGAARPEGSPRTVADDATTAAPQVPVRPGSPARVARSVAAASASAPASSSDSASSDAAALPLLSPAALPHVNRQEHSAGEVDRPPLASTETLAESTGGAMPDATFGPHRRALDVTRRIARATGMTRAAAPVLNRNYPQPVSREPRTLDQIVAPAVFVRTPSALDASVEPASTDTVARAADGVQPPAARFGSVSSGVNATTISASQPAPAPGEPVSSGMVATTRREAQGAASNADPVSGAAPRADGDGGTLPLTTSSAPPLAGNIRAESSSASQASLPISRSADPVSAAAGQSPAAADVHEETATPLVAGSSEAAHNAASPVTATAPTPVVTRVTVQRSPIASRQALPAALPLAQRRSGPERAGSAQEHGGSAAADAPSTPAHATPTAAHPASTAMRAASMTAHTASTSASAAPTVNPAASTSSHVASTTAHAASAAAQAPPMSARAASTSPHVEATSPRQPDSASTQPIAAAAPALQRSVEAAKPTAAAVAERQTIASTSARETYPGSAQPPRKTAPVPLVVPRAVESRPTVSMPVVARRLDAFARFVYAPAGRREQSVGSPGTTMGSPAWSRRGPGLAATPLLRKPWLPAGEGPTPISQPVFERVLSRRAASGTQVTEAVSAWRDVARSPAPLLAQLPQTVPIRAYGEPSRQADDQPSASSAASVESFDVSTAEGHSSLSSEPHASALLQTPPSSEAAAARVSTWTAVPPGSGYQPRVSAMPLPSYRSRAAGAALSAPLDQRAFGRAQSLGVADRPESTPSTSPLFRMLATAPPFLAMSPARAATPLFGAGARLVATVPGGSRDGGARPPFAGAPLADTDWRPLALSAGRGSPAEGGHEMVHRLPATGELMRAADRAAERLPGVSSATGDATTGALVLVRRFAASDARMDSGGAVLHPGMPVLVDVQRQAAPASAPAPAPASNPVEAAARTGKSQPNQGGSSDDVDELVDKVTRRLLRQLSIERERRGVNPCL